MSLGTSSLPPKKPVTNYLNSNYKMDTDIREYTAITPVTPIPTSQRALRLHIPQLVEPLILLDPTHLIIGRAKGEHRLDLSRQYAKLLGVSREHAELNYHAGHYYVTDLGSTNGTYLNNVKLTPNKPTRIDQNDQLRFGHFVAIVNYS